MFKRDREFNIISGESSNYCSQRALSYAAQRTAFQKEATSVPPINKLGTAKDRRMFAYNYSQP